MKEKKYSIFSIKTRIHKFRFRYDIKKKLFNLETALKTALM